MDQINKTVDQLVQSLIKLIQEKLSVSEKLVPNSFTQLFHHEWGTRHYHFSITGTTTKNNFDSSRKIPYWKTNKLKQLFTTCRQHWFCNFYFGSFMKLSWSFVLKPRWPSKFSFVVEFHIMAMNGAYKKLLYIIVQTDC